MSGRSVSISNAYYWMIYALYSFDLLSAKRDTKLIKAVSIMALIQTMLLIDVYSRLEALWRLPPLSKATLLIGFFGLLGTNWSMVSAGKWERRERILRAQPQRIRRICVVAAGLTLAGAFAYSVVSSFLASGIGSS